MENPSKSSDPAFTPPLERFIYRVKFTKGEQVKYIAHLDILRLFQRAINRAGLPVAHSRGFNPHQLVSFASPLTLGATSEGEYGDFEFDRPCPPEVIAKSLNSVLPEGVKITGAGLLAQRAKNAMASVDAADYIVGIDNEPQGLEDAIVRLMAMPEVYVMKKTKKSLKETDIRPDIVSIRLLPPESGRARIKMRLMAGSRRNLKPELAAEALYSLLGIQFDKALAHIHRVDLLAEHNGGFLSLLSEEV